MASGALFGVPLGVWLLSKADPLALRWGLAAIIAAALVLLISGWRYRGRPTEARAAAGVGVLGGVLSGAAQIGGPPIATYWLSTALSPEVVRANLVLYFAISHRVLGHRLPCRRADNWGLLMLALLIGPAYALGMFIGSRLFGVASEATFRWLCYALIAIATVVSLPILDTVLGR